MDLVSIIIPYYKKKRYFKKTIKSVINQNYNKLEIIIIYDDNDKEEYNFVKETLLPYKNIILINNKKNRGVSYSRNIGIKKAKGVFIAFLDSDDVWLPNKISLQLKFIRKNLCDLSYTNFNIINDSNHIIGKMKSPQFLNMRRLKYSCDIGLSTVMGKSTLFKKYKFPIIKTKEDYALWLKLAKKKYKLQGLDRTLTHWRDAKGSLSKSLMQKIQDAYTIFYHFEKRGVFFSIFSVFMMSCLFLKKRLLQKF